MRTLVVRWTGNSWAIMPSPNGTASQTWLSGIACTSETSCVAVGNTTNTGYGGQPYAMRMVGGTWSTVAVPAVPAGKGALSDVACTGPKSCFAVGAFGTSAGAKPLAERWNGQKWTTVAAAVPPGRAFARLRGVGCASASKCFAVGGTDTQETNAAIVERWNGTKWVMERQFTTPSGVSPSLDDVTCPTATRCRAVGNDGSAFVRTLAARWTGTTWSIEATKNRDEENYLAGVACWTAADCFAVGNSTESNAGPAHTLSERRSGSGWSIVATPDKDPQYNTLAGVDCIGAKLCFAVGTSNAPTAQRFVHSHPAMGRDPLDLDQDAVALSRVRGGRLGRTRS